MTKEKAVTKKKRRFFGVSKKSDAAVSPANRKKRKSLIITAALFAVAAILAVFLIGFAISMAAPGNAVRQECYPHTPNAISAILQSFYYSVCYLFEWTTVPLIVVLLILSPFISRAAAQSSWSFRYPGLFVLASFCVFTAQFTPPLYGMNSIGSDGARLLNIIYYSYFWFLIADVFYVSGYLVKKYGYNPNRVIRGMEKRKAFAVLRRSSR